MQATGENTCVNGTNALTAKASRRISRRVSIPERRAALVVQCARALPGADITAAGDIHLPLSVIEFERALRAHYGSSHPELVYRTDSTLERARLARVDLQHIPRVILRQGAPRRTTARSDIKQDWWAVKESNLRPRD